MKKKWLKKNEIVRRIKKVEKNEKIKQNGMIEMSKPNKWLSPMRVGLAKLHLALESHIMLNAN